MLKERLNHLKDPEHPEGILEFSSRLLKPLQILSPPIRHRLIFNVSVSVSISSATRHQVISIWMLAVQTVNFVIFTKWIYYKLVSGLRWFQIWSVWIGDVFQYACEWQVVWWQSRLNSVLLSYEIWLQHARAHTRTHTHTHTHTHIHSNPSVLQ